MSITTKEKKKAHFKSHIKVHNGLNVKRSRNSLYFAAGIRNFPTAALYQDILR